MFDVAKRGDLYQSNLDNLPDISGTIDAQSVL